MEGKFKRCFTQHALAHSLSGLGVGLILTNYIQYFQDNLLMVGVVALVVGVVVDMTSK